MELYFEIRTNGITQFGILKNIPDDVLIETIKKRVELQGEFESFEIVDKTFNDTMLDVEIDWMSIDYEESLNEDIIKINECLNDALMYGLESETVYAALIIMKENPDLTISEVIEKALNLTIN